MLNCFVLFVCLFVFLFVCLFLLLLFWGFFLLVCLVGWLGFFVCFVFVCFFFVVVVVVGAFSFFFAALEISQPSRTLPVSLPKMPQYGKRFVARGKLSPSSL